MFTGKDQLRGKTNFAKNKASLSGTTCAAENTKYNLFHYFPVSMPTCTLVFLYLFSSYLLYFCFSNEH